MWSHRTRPVGLGIMGFADLCLNLKVTYGSPASIDLMDEMMGFVRRESWNASIKLGAEKGAFPEFEPNREAYADFLYNQIGILARHSADAAQLRSDDYRADRNDFAGGGNVFRYRAKLLLGLCAQRHAGNAHLCAHARGAGSRN